MVAEMDCGREDGGGAACVEAEQNVASKASRVELEAEFVDETGMVFHLSLEFHLVHFHHSSLVEMLESQGEVGEEGVEAMEEVQEEMGVEAMGEEEGCRKSKGRSARSGFGSESASSGTRTAEGRLVSCHQIY